MGWTWYNVVEEWWNGKRVINRKQECDSLLTQEARGTEERWFPEMEVLKSSMVGSIYYAAVKTTYKDGSSKVWAAVFLTKVNGGQYYNFGYKDMDETCGPAECQCPKAILKLLRWYNKVVTPNRKYMIYSINEKEGVTHAKNKGL